jgi:hypothetical protein
MLLQASHVGYDPERREFGVYRRERTDDGGCGPNCGKIAQVLTWYLEEHEYARNNIRLEHDAGDWLIAIDNALLDSRRRAGLFLHLERLAVPAGNHGFRALRSLSTARVFRAAPELAAQLPAADAGRTLPIGDALRADMFYFRRPIAEDTEGDSQIERNLQPVMSAIVTARHPSLAAAQANTQIEFDRAYRSIVHSPVYRTKNLVFVSGLNIDISPAPGQPFPLTKFAPWAAYIQLRDGTHRLLEQEALWQALSDQDSGNPEEMDLESAIDAMGRAAEVRVIID